MKALGQDSKGWTGMRRRQLACGTNNSARALAMASLLLAASVHAEQPVKPDVDLYALMTGKCSRLTVAGRDFGCKIVAYFHSEKGRANFTVALDDPADDSHVISFSGEYGRRTEDNLYVLAVDRMLLSNKNRPKADGLPIPAEQASDGVCRQLGKFASREVSSITCSATDKGGKKYELTFESDGTPITLRRIRMSAPTIRLQDPYR
jgi:hypothetical protein